MIVFCNFSARSAPGQATGAGSAWRISCGIHQSETRNEAQRVSVQGQPCKTQEFGNHIALHNRLVTHSRGSRSSIIQKLTISQCSHHCTQLPTTTLGGTSYFHSNSKSTCFQSLFTFFRRGWDFAFPSSPGDSVLLFLHTTMSFYRSSYYYLRPGFMHYNSPGYFILLLLHITDVLTIESVELNHPALVVAAVSPWPALQSPFLPLACGVAAAGLIIQASAMQFLLWNTRSTFQTLDC